MYRPIVNKKMNYNNFKRHEYCLNWYAEKDNENLDKRYKRIQMLISRDEPYPYGEVVKDYYEFRYGCKINGFDFDSLYTDEKGRYLIKEGSKEWINYLNEPGLPYEESMKIINENHWNNFLEHTKIIVKEANDPFWNQLDRKWI